MPLIESGLKMSGLQEVIKDFEDLGIAVGEGSLDAVDRAGQILERSIKNNFLTMFHRNYATGTMEDSISHTAKREGDAAFGSAGVFKIDSVAAANIRDPDKAISRPQLAYWYETGIQPHSTTSGAKVARNKNQGSRMTSAIAPKPFISAAYDANSEQIIREMSATIGSYIDKAGSGQ